MNDHLEQFVQHYFGSLLLENGFRKISYRGSRWIRIVDGSVYMSIQFVPYYGSFEIYYSFQPFFVPLILPQSRIAYHSEDWLYFDPMAEYYAIAKQKMPPSLFSPFENQNAMDQVAAYWKNALQTLALPMLHSVHDVTSCCEAHRRRYSLVGVPDILKLHYNGRYLLECAYMENRKECERICNLFLIPMLQSYGPDKEFFYIDDQTIPIGELISDIQGSMDILHQRMVENYKKTEKIIFSIYKRCGPGDG